MQTFPRPELCDGHTPSPPPTGTLCDTTVHPLRPMTAAKPLPHTPFIHTALSRSWLCRALVAALLALPGTRAPAADAPAAEIPVAETPQEAEPGSRLLEVREAVDTRLEELATVARDYAHWDEAYGFAAGTQRRFPGEGLLAPALASLDIHYMLVLDRQQQPRLSLSINTPPARQAAVPAYPELVEALQQAISAGELNSREQSLRGLVMVDGQYALIAARPVLRERRDSTPGGWLLFARSLDSAALDELLMAAEPAARSLSGAALESAQLPSEVRGWLEAQTEAPLFQHASSTHMSTWLALRDLAGRALWAASLDTPLPPEMQPAPVPATPPAAVPQHEPRGSGWLVTLLALVAAAGAVWAWRRHQGAALPPRAKPPAHAAPRPGTPLPAARPAAVSSTSAPTAATTPAPTPASSPPPGNAAPPAVPAPTAVPAPAVAADQIVVLYQPVIDLHSECVCGLEALPRWKDAARGWILPQDPLLIASPDGEALDIAQFVIGQIARDISAWRGQGLTPVPVSVNVATAVENRDRLRHTLQRLAETDSLCASLLQLEVADELLLDHRTGGMSEEIILRWHELDLPLVIDHVGARARKTPLPDPGNIDALKLDANLVRNLSVGSSEGNIARDILREAREQDICVIAEGVDLWSQLETLRGLGCQQAQGPLLAPPATAAHTARFLRDGQIDMHDRLSETDELPMLGAPRS